MNKYLFIKKLHRIVVTFVLLSCNYVSYAEVLRNLTWDQYVKYLNDNDVSVFTDDGMFRFYSLTHLVKYLEKASSELCADYVTNPYLWNYDLTDMGSNETYCYYWDTNVLSCDIKGVQWEWICARLFDEDNIPLSSIYHTSTARKPPFSVPEKWVDENGREYIIKYFAMYKNDCQYLYYPGIFEIPNTIESFWWCSGYYKTEKNEAHLSADTLIVGTSIRCIPILGDCEVLYLKSGIPYHYTHITGISSLIDYFTYAQQRFIQDSSNNYFNKDYTYRHLVLREIHIPHGFRKYYSALDTISGVKLIDDLPVVTCSEIKIRKTITQGGYTYNGRPASLDYYVDIPESTIQIAVGDTLRLDILCEPYDATVRYSAKMSSSDTTIAKVDSLATVTGLSEGTATITATALDGSGVTSSITVNVSGYNTSVSSLPVRQENRTKSTYYDLYGKAIPYPTTKGLYINNGKKVFITDK